MSKHTPGPWALKTVPTSVGSCHKIGLFPSKGVRVETYACVYADGIRLGIDEQTAIGIELLANAQLIAAAPDLLFVAQFFLRGIEGGHIKCASYIDFDPEASSLEIKSPEARLREAIAKATGAAP